MADILKLNARQTVWEKKVTQQPLVSIKHTKAPPIKLQLFLRNKIHNIVHHVNRHLFASMTDQFDFIVVGGMQNNPSNLRKVC